MIETQTREWCWVDRVKGEVKGDATGWLWRPRYCQTLQAEFSSGASDETSVFDLMVQETHQVW
jgi:hypothetical protein